MKVRSDVTSILYQVEPDVSNDLEKHDAVSDRDADAGMLSSETHNAQDMHAEEGEKKLHQDEGMAQSLNAAGDKHDACVSAPSIIEGEVVDGVFMQDNANSPRLHQSPDESEDILHREDTGNERLSEGPGEGASEDRGEEMQDMEQRLEQPDKERQDKAPGRKEEEEAEGTDSALQASKPSRKLRLFKPPGQETLAPPTTGTAESKRKSPVPHLKLGAAESQRKSPVPQESSGTSSQTREAASEARFERSLSCLLQSVVLQHMRSGAKLRS